MGKRSTPAVDVKGLPPNNTRCGECGEPQFRASRSGVTCVNGHGGADELPLEPTDEAPIEPVWLEWKKRAARELAVLLADTIDVKPSANDEMRAAVEAMIALEAELSG